MESNNSQEKSDQELVQLSIKDQDNFLYLMERYEKRLMRYIMRISNCDFNDAEDILQEVFIKVYRNLNNYDSKLKFSSWIYRITHNEVISDFRKKKIRPQKMPSESNEEMLEKITADIDIEKEIDNKINRKAIMKLLNNIDIKYKEVLILRFIEDKSYQEISDILQKPNGTVATLINRAKKVLLQEIKTAGIKFN